MTELGAPSGWQIMSYGTMDVSSCSGLDEGTLMHEMLHALGVKHEHARPDREQFLIVDMEATTMDSQFTLIDADEWIQIFDSNGDDVYPYETTSVMHYCSMCGASGSDPVMTYQDGSTFGSGEFMTTTDSLQIIWNYCNADADQGNPGETTQCLSNDKFGVQRPVYLSRVCDGRFDCFGGEDEIDGSMAVCVPETTLDSGCCGAYWVGGIEYTYFQDFDGAGVWRNPNDHDKMILKWPSGTWYHGTSGLPVSGQSFSYSASSTATNPNNALCPPVDTSWVTTGGNSFSVLCKSSGAQFNSVNECLDNPCDAVATCTDTVAGFTCSCPETHTGDGFTCTEIVLEDECANGTSGCPELCTDEIQGFTCSCQEGQFDENGDGTVCLDVAPCCKVFNMGINNFASLQMQCTFNRTHSGHGFMEYECGANPDITTASQFTFPQSVQFFPDNFTPSGYMQVNGGLLPEGQTPILSIRSQSQPPVGANCPSMNSADWSPNGSNPWNIECIEFFETEDPADPDQCTEGTHNCHADATCTDTETGFTCACNSGFSGDGVQTCTPLVDECTNGTHNCHQNAFCTNTPDAFDCVCLDGFNGDGVTCTQIDVDECSDGTHQCDTTVSQCVNNQGDYDCVCDGNHLVQVDSKTCADRDECAEGDPCNTANNGVCTNHANGFTCSCVAGFQSDGTNCVDINECAASPTPCDASATCTNLPGSHSCGCNSGFELSADGVCVDINECDTGNNVCAAAGLDCVNLEGDYSCTCETGFEHAAGDNKLQCQDVDECANDACLIQMANPATCTNTPGSFTCDCLPGFQILTGTTIECVDVDECVQPVCQDNASCTNTEGGFQCTCEAGWQEDTTAGAANTCIDIDECSLEDVCNQAQGNPVQCNNLDGSFECVCDAGYTMDSAGVCTDQNECLNNPCGENVDCVNVDGGFECICPAGFVMGSDGFCEDIDECVTATTTNVCGLAQGNAAICNNTPGSWECSCETGYLVDDNGWCNDIDECNLFRMRVSCSANTDCANTPGSFECTCKEGFEGVQRNFGVICQDINECDSATLNTCPTGSNCVNVPGSHTCECPTGTSNTCEQENCWDCVQDNPCETIQCEDGFTCIVDASGVAGFCEDIDECTAADACADPNAICSNTPGSFECNCPTTMVDMNGTCVPPCQAHECQAGFECQESQIAGIAIVNCVDINECTAADNVCTVNNLNCNNLQGDYSCVCPSGTEFCQPGDNKTCCTVDPCADVVCPADATCNAAGVCECPTGFFLNENADSTLFCDEVTTDPCANVVCPADATCNAAGVCECPAGFFLNENADSTLFCDEVVTDLCANVVCPDNATCNPNGVCQCADGFFMNEDANSNLFCQEINPDLCATVACEAGFTCLAGQCVDVDECADGTNMCDSFEICVNEQGSYSCTFDPAVCPASQVVWKGAKFGRIFYRGQMSIELRITISNKGLDVRDSTYFGMLMFGRKKCGGDFLNALTDGRVRVDVMDKEGDHIYNVIDTYHRDDATRSATQIMFELFNTQTVDDPVKQGVENAKKDQMWVSFWGLETVDFGNKNWEACLEGVTVGAIQEIADGNENFTNACATWQKTLWN